MLRSFGNLTGLVYFGCCADENRCTEKEERRVGKFEDGERNLHCAEKLRRDVDSASVSTPCPVEKQDSRKRHNDGIDLNKKPKQRPKMKKHRPKIALDRWTPRRTPKAQTPRKSTPKNLKPSTPKNVNLGGKRYSGKSSNSKGLTNTSENVISETSTCVAASCKRSLRFECVAVDNCNDVVESCNRARQHRYHPPSVEGFSLQVSTDSSVCSDSNTESNERDENCFKRFSYHYQRRMRGVDGSSLRANIDINIGTEECTKSSFTPHKNELMVDYPHEMKKQSVLHENDLYSNSKAGCLQFYRRTFRVNQCRQNSRKSGPNFPKICKKSRTVRLKATTFLTLSSIVQGARGVAKRKRAHGRCKQITRNFCAQINWKIVRKGARSLRKSKYQRSFSVCCDNQIEKSLLKMIMPTEKQTQAAIADPESFKCVVSLSPVAKSRGKRSKGSIRQIIRNPLVVNYNSDQLPVYTPSYGSVYEPETLKEPQLLDSENYRSWRKNTSGFCNEDNVACDSDMEGGHHVKETHTQNLVEVQLPKYENYMDRSLYTPSIFLDDVEAKGNKRLQPYENYLDCSLNTPSFFLNDVYTHGNKRLQPDGNHLNCSLNTSSFFLDDVEAHCNERLQPENYLDLSLNNCLDVVVYQDVNNPPQHKAVRSSHKCKQKDFFTCLIILLY